ncbi:MAG: hypothetical protein GXN92_02430 [Candidatus Micrarchaeota archaeon]|nr:hypothetical protein [Candidatus Micrarchaeota archaeon]
MDYLLAMKLVFKRTHYLILGWLVFLGLLALNFYIMTGEGDLQTRISTFVDIFLKEPLNILLAGLLTIFAGISIPMSIYANREAAKNKKIEVKEGLMGIVSAVISTIVVTASCVACLSPFVALLGVGGALFLSQYSVLISLIGLGLIFLSIQWAAEKILGICKTC